MYFPGVMMPVMKSLAFALALTSFAIGHLHAQAIVGGWSIKNAGEAKSTAVLTFLPNGVYVMAEDGNPKLDPSGKDGMERGTYKWNAKTKAFSINTLVDTTGEWGLSDADFETAVVAGKKLTITDESGSFSLKAVSGGSKLVGSWYLKSGAGYAVATFLADGTYFMVQDGKASGGGKTGVERGTYKWNATTKVFTRKVLTDTNGTWGFSDNVKRTILVAGNKLTLKVTGEDPYTLTRAVAP